jgi:hypothetical protein
MKREWRNSVNTDQAFELLTDAGVPEDISILTVRRWLRERKINYEGTSQRKTGNILVDTVHAVEILKDAGVAESVGIQIAQRWMREGKIQNMGNGNRRTEHIPNETSIKRSLNSPTDQDKTIRQLKVRIKTQNEQIEGFEQLHKTSINILIQQRDKLRKEIIRQENEKNELQRESKKLLQENIDLRDELLILKEEFSKGKKRERDKTQTSPQPSKTNDYRQKLGLSKTASHKEVLAGYKSLLKITHPDQGGNETAFHYIKTEYDYFRNSIKG